MKKLLVTLCLNSIIICAYAQKTYKDLVLTIASESSLKNVGNNLNDLNNQGYVVEKMVAGWTLAQSYYVDIILSKDEIQNNEEKSYVFMGSWDGSDWILSGDIPSGMSSKYGWSQCDKCLNDLSDNGFQLELFDGEQYSKFILLSQKKSDKTSIVNQKAANEAIKEIARYNLEGLPVDKSYEGIQIIVYSNYTTKVLNTK